MTISEAWARVDLRPKQNTIPSSNTSRPLGAGPDAPRFAETTSRVETSRGLEREKAVRLLLPVVSQIWDAAPLKGKLRTHPMTRKWSRRWRKPQANCVRPWPTDQFSFADSRTFTNTFS